MRYDRARKNLDRHANYILAAYMPQAPDHRGRDPATQLPTRKAQITGIMPPSAQNP
jgi:hypothetical protein